MHLLDFVVIFELACLFTFVLTIHIGVLSCVRKCVCIFQLCMSIYVCLCWLVRINKCLYVCVCVHASFFLCVFALGSVHSERACVNRIFSVA